MDSQVRSREADRLAMVDWEEARALMKRVIASNVKGRTSSDELEDLVQEASVGLMRAVCRGHIDNMEAMQVTIAKRIAINRIRRLRHINSIDSAADTNQTMERIPDSAGDEEASFEPGELQFYVREVLRSIDAGCRSLFEHWLECLNMRVTAERMGIAHAAARQRWVRCIARARELLRSDTGPLGEWARELP